MAIRVTSQRVKCAVSTMGLMAVAGCAIDPANYAPSSGSRGGNACPAPPFGTSPQSSPPHKHDSNAPDAALRTDLVALHNQADALHQRLMDLTALSADEANKLRTEISAIHAAKIINKVERHAARARNIKYFLPDSMAEDNVSQSLANFLVHHTAKTIKQVTAKGAKHAEDRAKWEALMATDRSMADAAVREHLHKLAGMPFFMTSTDAQRVDDAINKVVSNTKPDSMSTNNILGRNDFEKFFAAFISPTGKNAHRFVQYESYYFGGNFVDRFGNALPKPTLSLNITDLKTSAARLRSFSRHLQTPSSIRRCGPAAPRIPTRTRPIAR